MTKTFIGRTVFILIAFVSLLPAYAQYHGRHEHGRHHGEKERGISYISGKIISTEDDSPLDFATVYLKGTTYGCTSVRFFSSSGTSGIRPSSFCEIK